MTAGALGEVGAESCLSAFGRIIVESTSMIKGVAGRASTSSPDARARAACGSDTASSTGPTRSNGHHTDSPPTRPHRVTALTDPRHRGAQPSGETGQIRGLGEPFEPGMRDQPVADHRAPLHQPATGTHGNPSALGNRLRCRNTNHTRSEGISCDRQGSLCKIRG